MTGEPQVITECYADTLLIEKILKNSVNHQKGNGKVSNKMIDRNNETAIGIIDDDSRKPGYFDEFDLIKDYSDFYFKVYKHPDQNHYFIVIMKANEDYVIKNAVAANINQEQYKDFFDIKSLKDICKKVSVSANKNYNTFLDDIIRENPPSIVELRRIIKDLLG